MEEQVFFDERGVKVTNARFITFGKTQTLAGITSVSSFIEKPKRTLPIVLGIIGLICFSFSYILAIILIIAAVAIWVIQKPEYIVRLESASGSVDALKDKDSGFIDKVINALNDAIVHRG